MSQAAEPEAKLTEQMVKASEGLSSGLLEHKVKQPHTVTEHGQLSSRYLLQTDSRLSLFLWERPGQVRPQGLPSPYCGLAMVSHNQTQMTQS